MPILNALRPQHSQGTNLITKEKWLEKIVNGEITDATTTMYQIIDDNEYATVDQIIDTLTKNVGAHLANANLLDNSDFKINQRGLSEYNTKGYTVDKWKLEIDHATLTILDDGINISTDGNDATSFLFAQDVNNPTGLIGTTVTLSAKYSGYSASIGLFAIGIIAWDSNGAIITQSQTPFIDSIGTLSSTFTVPVGTTKLQVVVNKSVNNAVASINLEWMKLELGDKATMFVPPHPATELIKCQRHYAEGYITFRMSDCAISESSDFIALPMINYPVPMYKTPTVKIYSLNGIENTLTVWDSGEDSTTYNSCMVNSNKMRGNVGFDSLTLIDPTVAAKFSSSDNNFYTCKYVAFVNSFI